MSATLNWLSSGARMAWREFASGRLSRMSWTFVDQCIVSGSNFIIGIVVARLLGIEQFGIYTLGMMIVWLVQGLNNALVYAPMLSIGPRQTGEARPAYFGAVLCHQGLLFLLVLLAALVASVVSRFAGLGAIQGHLLLAASAAGIGLMAQEFMRRYFYSTGRPHLSAVNSLLAYGLQGAGLLVLYQISQLGVTQVFLVAAGGGALAVAINARNIDGVTWQRDVFRDVTLRHWHLAKWLVASVVAYWASGNVFYIVAGAVLGPVAVGAMRAATLVLAIGNIVMQGLDNYLPVSLADTLHHRGADAARRQFLRISGASVVAIAFISLLASVDPGLWMQLIFGHQYRGYEWLVYIFAILNVFNTLYVVGAGALRVLERSRYIFFAWATMAVFSTLAATPIVRTAGLAGASWGIVLAQTLGVLLIGFGVWHAWRNLEPLAHTRVPAPSLQDRPG